MSRCCHECGCNVENPFYGMSAVLVDMDNKRMACSNLEVSLCKDDFEKIKLNGEVQREKIEGCVGFVVDAITGACGGFLGTVQISSGVYDRHGQYIFFNKATVLSKLPKCANDLLNTHAWAEKTLDGEWKEAAWAEEIYKRLLKEQH